MIFLIGLTVGAMLGLFLGMYYQQTTPPGWSQFNDFPPQFQDCGVVDEGGLPWERAEVFSLTSDGIVGPAFGVVAASQLHQGDVVEIYASGGHPDQVFIAVPWKEGLPCSPVTYR